MALLRIKKFQIIPNTCPSPGCGDNVEILDQADALGTFSDLPLYNPKGASQSSRISPLMSETFAYLHHLYGWKESRVQQLNKPKVI